MIWRVYGHDRTVGWSIEQGRMLILRTRGSQIDGPIAGDFGMTGPWRLLRHLEISTVKAIISICEADFSGASRLVLILARDIVAVAMCQQHAGVKLLLVRGGAWGQLLNYIYIILKSKNIWNKIKYII